MDDTTLNSHYNQILIDTTHEISQITVKELSKTDEGLIFLLDTFKLELTK